MGIESAAVRDSLNGRIGGHEGANDLDADRFESILCELAAVNRAYLDVLVAQAELSEPTMRQLRAASSDALDAMATCPFALFSIESLVGLDTANVLHRRALNAEHSPMSICASAAYFFAWHLVRIDPLAVRVLLGMDAAQSDYLRTLSLAKLQTMVRCSARPLQPRWPNHEYFWGQLAQCAVDRHADAVCAVHLLGRQILAAEAVASIPAVTARSRRRSVRYSRSCAAFLHSPP